MLDDHNDLQENSPNYELQQPLPRELAIAAAALVAIMVVMGVALWAVARGSNEQHGQTNAYLPEPTAELLETLADDLGPQATAAELQAAVTTWLSDQESDRGTRVVLTASAVDH